MYIYQSCRNGSITTAAALSFHLPPHICNLSNVARRQHESMNEIHLCICVSSEHAEVQPGYWLFKARGQSLTFHVRICWHGGGGALQLRCGSGCPQAVLSFSYLRGETSHGGMTRVLFLTVRFSIFWLCENLPFILTAGPTQKHLNPEWLADTAL